MATNLLKIAQDRAKMIEQGDAIVARAEKENRELTVEERAELDGLIERVENADQDIRRFSTLEKFRVSNENRGLNIPIVPEVDEIDADFFRVGMTEKEIREYRFTRAILAAADSNWSRAGLEMEAWKRVEERFGITANGFFVPFDVLEHRVGLRGIERRDVTVAAEGADLVAKMVEPGSFIDLLYNASVLRSLGASFFTGLSGDLQIPRATAGSTTAWVTEGNAPSESTPTFDQVLLQPSSLAAYSAYTRKMLLQSSIDVENWLRGDMATAIAVELTRAALHGSGTGAEPEGLENLTGIGLVICGDPDGAAPTMEDIIDLETEVSQDNAATGRLAYVTNSKVRGKLKKTDIGSDTGSRVWSLVDSATPVNSYPAVVTNSVRSDLTKGIGTGLSAMFFGNWADVLVGFWGGLDVLVDPYSEGTARVVRVTTFQETDIQFRHPESFAQIIDAVTT